MVAGILGGRLTRSSGRHTATFYTRERLIPRGRRPTVPPRGTLFPGACKKTLTYFRSRWTGTGQDDCSPARAAVSTAVPIGGNAWASLERAVGAQFRRYVVVHAPGTGNALFVGTSAACFCLRMGSSLAQALPGNSSVDRLRSQRVRPPFRGCRPRHCAQRRRREPFHRSEPGASWPAIVSSRTLRDRSC